MKKYVTAILSVIVMFSLIACGLIYEEIELDNLILGDVLPELSVTKGRIISDSDTSLSVEIKCDDIKVYDEYVDNCKVAGFEIDAEEDEDYYKAYNSDGYKLMVDYSNITSTLTIDLDAPMETSEINFYSSPLAALIPTPDSNIGNISWDSSDLFSVSVANTPIETYKAYVDSCYSAGFNIDYYRGDDYYHANNTDGYSLSVEYEGFNIMYISVKAPESTETEVSQGQTTISEKVEESKSEENSSSNDIEKTDAEEFAEENGVSVELAESIEAALAESEHSYKLSQLYNWTQIDDWANGERYTGWMSMEYVWVFYVEGDSLKSIRQQNGLSFIWSAE